MKQAENKGRDQLLLRLNGLTLSVYEGVCVFDGMEEGWCGGWGHSVVWACVTLCVCEIKASESVCVCINDDFIRYAFIYDQC